MLQRTNPRTVFAIAGLLAALLVVYVFAGGKRENPDKLTREAPIVASSPEVTNAAEPEVAVDTPMPETEQAPAQSESATAQAAPVAEAAPAPRRASPPPIQAPPPPRKAAPSSPKPKASPPPAPRATANPSFNCRYAKTRGEVAVCNDDGLAGFDRQMASQFNRALASADPAQRALLLRTRSRFLAFRDACGSNACMAGAYRDRIREIADIMAGRWNP